MKATPSRNARLRRTLGQLRQLWERSAYGRTVGVERRTVEANAAERRRYRSDKELRAQREELQRQWEARWRDTRQQQNDLSETH
jgi:hypothetical protein